MYIPTVVSPTTAHGMNLQNAGTHARIGATNNGGCNIEDWSAHSFQSMVGQFGRLGSISRHF